MLAPGTSVSPASAVLSVSASCISGGDLVGKLRPAAFSVPRCCTVTVCGSSRGPVGGLGLPLVVHDGVACSVKAVDWLADDLYRKFALGLPTIFETVLLCCSVETLWQSASHRDGISVRASLQCARIFRMLTIQVRRRALILNIMCSTRTASLMSDSKKLSYHCAPALLTTFLARPSEPQKVILSNTPKLVHRPSAP